MPFRFQSVLHERPHAPHVVDGLFAVRHPERSGGTRLGILYVAGLSFVGFGEVGCSLPSYSKNAYLVLVEFVVGLGVRLVAVPAVSVAMFARLEYCRPFLHRKAHDVRTNIGRRLDRF